MNRRSFSKHALALPFLPGSASLNPTTPKRILPKRLRPGDTVGFVTPGSYISDESLEQAVSNMLKLGLRVKMGKNIRAKHGFVAGTDQQRLDDLHTMFSDRSVDAVWCARGGYGCTRLLPKIDYDLIRRNPKILIGYSDITALLNAIYHKTGLVTFHGPVGASEFSTYTEAQVRAVLMDGTAPYPIPLSEDNEASEDSLFQPEVIRKGQAEGVLMGGNLSLLAAMAGTGYLPDPTGAIVFMEDVGEAPYRVDRMLTQLRQAWPLKAANGIALGVFADCAKKEGSDSLTLSETLQEQLRPTDTPTAYGLPFGHIDHQCTFPVGVRARFDAAARSITLLEAGVR
ncbi:MAG: LD-carboxypeptidase [Phaeodactylibacter sp.]|uniref:S66 peptidase family protein n=1 Tax=Phaeodactylibacter sp. TaxID=1940289 RepID=UPI0032ED84CD